MRKGGFLLSGEGGGDGRLLRILSLLLVEGCLCVWYAVEALV